jgi:phosphonate transport system substrate-binding protein
MTRRNFIRDVAALGLAAALAGTAGMIAADPASAAEKIRFAVTDIDGLESLQREYGPFKAAFEKASGLQIDLFPVSGRTAAVEAMAADQVDFVLTGPAEYVVFHARLKAEPVVVWTRPDYRSSIVVPEESPVKSLADLKGKKISFGDIGSTSQHLGPATILADAGLTYGRDYEAVFLKLNVATEALLKGDLAAIGMNQTHLARITKAFPDKKFRSLGEGINLPNDLIVVSAKVKPETVATFRKAFLEQSDQIMAAVVSAKENKKFEGGKFLPNVTDKDYDVVRRMFVNVGVKEFSKFIGN